MGFFERMFNRLRNGEEADEEDYDYEYEDDYADSEEEEYDNRSYVSSRRERNVQTQEKPKLFARQKTQTQDTRSGNMQVVLIKPVSYDDVVNICKPLLEGKTVVINMEGMHSDLSRRIIDFTSGVIFSIDGKLQKISNYIIIATPPAVKLGGDFADMISNAYDTQGFMLKV